MEMVITSFAHISEEGLIAMQPCLKKKKIYIYIYKYIRFDPGKAYSWYWHTWTAQDLMKCFYCFYQAGQTLYQSKNQ